MGCKARRSESIAKESVELRDVIIHGTRKGYELSREDGYIYVVYTHMLVRGELKPIDDRRIHKIKES